MTTWYEAYEVLSPDDELWVKAVWEEEYPQYQRLVWNENQETMINPFQQVLIEREIPHTPGIAHPTNLFNDPWGPQTITDPAR